MKSLHDYILWIFLKFQSLLLKASDSISISQTLTLKHNIHKRGKENQFANFSQSRWKAQERVLHNFRRKEQGFKLRRKLGRNRLNQIWKVHSNVNYWELELLAVFLMRTKIFFLKVFLKKRRKQFNNFSARHFSCMQRGN